MKDKIVGTSIYISIYLYKDVYLSVDDLVAAERARLPEAFPAHLADERTRAGVHGHVASEVVVGVEHLDR